MGNLKLINPSMEVLGREQGAQMSRKEAKFGRIPEGGVGPLSSCLWGCFFIFFLFLNLFGISSLTSERQNNVVKRA